MKSYLFDTCRITLKQTLLWAEVAHWSVMLIPLVVWNKPLQESSVHSSANQIIYSLTGRAIRGKRQFVWRNEGIEKGTSNNSGYGVWYIPGREECKSWVCPQPLAQVQWRSLGTGLSCSVPVYWKSVSAVVLQSSLAMRSYTRACYKAP